MKEKNRQRRLRLVAEAKKKPAVFTVYIILRLIVVAILVSSILRGEYENAAICLLVLFLFLLPLFVQKNFGIELPGTLEIIILVFIFASEILGELGCFFINVPNWDSILHTTTGFISAAFGFALVDLDEDGTPELICGEIDTKGQSEQIALTDYTLYTWKNDQVTELYHGFVDTWINPDVRVTTAGAIVNEGHGTSAGYELQYVRWDGVQIEHHDFWSYAKTEDVSGERVCYLDDVEVSEAVFDERLAACTADDEYVLHFLASTPENCRKYLRDSIQASRQPEQPQLNEQELLALLQENLAWLNAVEGETFFVEGQGSYMAIVSYENGQYGRIKRLVPSPATTSELESTLAEDEAIDPTFSSYYPISNYSSKEQILDNLREYMDVDSLGIMQNAYATVSDVLNDNVWEFNGGLYLVRGGRGYGVFNYDPQTLKIVSFDETTCEAECDLMRFGDYFDSVQTISFEKRSGRWIITHVAKAQSSADPYTITAETRADRSLYPRPERTLERGSQGEDVKYVQAMLVVMNYDGVVVDGDFGPATEAALMRWQKNHSLTQTGVVDADTLQQLEAAETEWLLRE